MKRLKLYYNNIYIGETKRKREKENCIATTTIL